MSLNLRVLALIFVATVVCNALGVVYQRLVHKEHYIKATTISVAIAGLSLLIWRFCLTESDLTSSIPAIGSYLMGDALGTYAGLRYKIDGPVIAKK